MDLVAVVILAEKVLPRGERLAVIAAAASVLAGCGSGSGSYTQESIKAGFVEPADLGVGDVRNLF